MKLYKDAWASYTHLSVKLETHIFTQTSVFAPCSIKPIACKYLPVSVADMKWYAHMGLHEASLAD